jgi:UPF0716 protein FxsA
MLGKLLVLFIAVPLLELAILVRLGMAIGFWPTIALVVTTGTVGALLARSQGLRTLQGIRTELAHGQMPALRLLDGVLILIGGVVLLTPGILTDVVGLLLLLPGPRHAFRRLLQRRLERMLKSGAVNIMTLRR